MTDRPTDRLTDGQEGKEHNNGLLHFSSNISADYIKEKEAAQEQKRIKYMTAWQRDRKSDHEMWEKNRMLRSGTEWIPGNI